MVACVLAAAANVPKATMRILDGADHGFAVLKSSGRTKEDVWSEAGGVMASWLHDQFTDKSWPKR